MDNFATKPVTKKKPSWVHSLVLLIIFVLAVGLGVFGFWFFNKNFVEDKTNAFVESEVAYQAVFLTNDQVYFAKVENKEEKFVVLTDIYYLHLRQDLQNPKDKDDSGVSLVKLGNELHGPEDKMFINRDHILFIEPLKQSSKVVDAIREDKMGKNN